MNNRVNESPAAALDPVVLDLARGPHAAEPGARVSALEVLAHQVGGAVRVALALLGMRKHL